MDGNHGLKCSVSNLGMIVNYTQGAGTVWEEARFFLLLSPTAINPDARPLDTGKRAILTILHINGGP